MEDLENYKLEIQLLQEQDTKTAKDNGFETKKAWFEYIIKQEQDPIAEAIIDIAIRYDLPLERVAYDFDSTMTMRVGTILAKRLPKTKKKAA